MIEYVGNALFSSDVYKQEQLSPGLVKDRAMAALPPIIHGMRGMLVSQQERFVLRLKDLKVDVESIARVGEAHDFLWHRNLATCNSA